MLTIATDLVALQVELGDIRASADRAVILCASIRARLAVAASKAGESEHVVPGDDHTARGHEVRQVMEDLMRDTEDAMAGVHVV